jgi:GcrA cell cycle regulator
MAWSDEDTERLKVLHKDGLSASQIAKKLTGRHSRNAVIGKVHRMGLGSIGGAKAAPPAKAPKKVAPPRKPSFGAIGLKAPAVKREGAGRNALHIAEAKSVPGFKPPSHVEDVTLAKPLFSRQLGECCAPVSGDGADTLYCCHPVKDETPYCQAHAARFYSGKPKRSAADLERSLRRVA